jgi:hypothetical protein
LIINKQGQWFSLEYESLRNVPKDNLSGSNKGRRLPAGLIIAPVFKMADVIHRNNAAE